jgi:hypothetical protein
MPLFDTDDKKKRFVDWFHSDVSCCEFRLNASNASTKAYDTIAHRILSRGAIKSSLKHPEHAQLLLRSDLRKYCEAKEPKIKRLFTDKGSSRSRASDIRQLVDKAFDWT